MFYFFLSNMNIFRQEMLLTRVYIQHKILKRLKKQSKMNINNSKIKVIN